MRFLRYLHDPGPGYAGCVATIGNFDGVHVGHQAVLGQVKGLAAELGLPAAVILFEPQPLEFFAGTAAPARLTSLREKLRQLPGFGIDRVACLRFDRALAGLSPREFVADVLVRGLGAKRVVVGEDFRFGRDRQGDLAMLKSLARESGFEVVGARTLSVDGERASSSRIRDLLAAGDLDRAARLLGRPYRMSGRVVRGDARGRELGFPTANVDLSRRRPPLDGIFAVRVIGLNGGMHDGVASIGTRPVFGGGHLVLEAHLFDFNDVIYGRRIEVEFVRRLRAERNFESAEALRAQMAVDAQQAQDILRSSARTGGDA
ncbi:MAG TPA: bifunctional riboflavin kinase/FAD synthetase [Gammaproteobacteria bacterium]